MKNKKGISRRSFITNTALAGIGTIGSANLIGSCVRKDSAADKKIEPDRHEFNSS